MPEPAEPNPLPRLSEAGVMGFAGWQWLMLLSGLPCVLVAVVLWGVLTNAP